MKQTAVSDRIKKTCNGCKAYEFHHVCALGFKNDRGVPKEPCPKPRTLSKFIENTVCGGS